MAGLAATDPLEVKGAGPLLALHLHSWQTNPLWKKCTTDAAANSWLGFLSLPGLDFSG